MRIFYAAPTSPNDIGLPDSKLWYANLYLPLKDLGHELITFDFDYGEFQKNLDAIPSQNAFIRENRPRLSDELLGQIKAAHQIRPIDVFFSYFYSAHVEPEAIRQISQLGITTVNWYCNASYQFHLVSEIAPAYNYCLVPERFRLEDYRHIGANPIYCQEAANPNIYRPYDMAVEFDVTFVGQQYGNRPYYIRQLIDAGIDTRVWGPNWIQGTRKLPLWRHLGSRVKRKLLGLPPYVTIPTAICGEALNDDDLIKMYSRSKISLGFSTVAHLPRRGENTIKQVRLRDFEATMSGAFYMVEAFDELAEFFEPDKEIIFFDSPKELIDKARYYLSHAQERERIRQAALHRARAEHTWQQRFQQSFEQMGLKSE